jgi:hypothetical protein
MLNTWQVGCGEYTTVCKTVQLPGHPAKSMVPPLVGNNHVAPQGNLWVW